MKDPLFIGIYPGGIVYADRTQNVNRDYKRLAFLSFRTLVLDFQPDCPLELAERIKCDAGRLQAQRGEKYPISGSGQSVVLGRE